MTYVGAVTEDAATLLHLRHRAWIPFPDRRSVTMFQQPPCMLD